ncbi:hypothetical protein JX360_16075 [Synechococcus bigranulatus str. 'Rupite']|uniref:Uncharacterized protein n=2 Tax=Thermostichus vulcanus TaxID=32053 RepID=A0ABT0CF46_THEVL|nr:hypothetical protein [Thermostichus vulcanus str. 'Rupite']
MGGDVMINTPEALRRSFEQFMLNVTEPLDPLISLKLTQLVVMLGDTAYAMGYSDGQQKPDDRCRHCPSRVFESLDL